MEVAGKTGTAQTGYVAKPDDDPKLAGFYSQTHAWFAAFYPARAPEVAVVVLAEHGGSGPTQAAPVAMQVLREYRRIRGQKGPDFPAKTSRPSVPGEEQPGEDAQTMPSPSDPTTEATSPAVPPIPPADPGHENGTDLTDPVDEESP
jgi:penicillin-binding protein 2